MANENIVNGVDVDRLAGTIDLIKGQPDLAQFQFRAQAEWVEGGHSRTTIQGFHGAGAEDTSRATPFVLEGDEPPVLLGSNAGPNAVDANLHAVASCLMVGVAYNAAAMGIRVARLAFSLEGDIDLHGFLGLSDQIRPGYQNVRLTYWMESDAAPEQLDALWAHVQKTSPVLDILRNPVEVTIAVAG